MTRGNVEGDTFVGNICALADWNDRRCLRSQSTQLIVFFNQIYVGYVGL